MPRLLRVATLCADYHGGKGRWCKHVAALLCELIHKLNTNGLLYLKLLAGRRCLPTCKEPAPF